MRVIAGAWRGRRLRAGPGGAIRPTTDRVKEALFAVLGRETVGTVFVDLCCGAGGLGIEALSRGASSVVFVDRDPGALALVRRNLADCGATRDRFRLVRADAGRWLERAGAGGELRRAIALADPPYGGDLANVMLANLLARIAAAELRTGILEHEPRIVPASASGITVDTRRYGRTCLTFIRPAGEQIRTEPEEST